MPRGPSANNPSVRQGGGNSATMRGSMTMTSTDHQPAVGDATPTPSATTARPLRIPAPRYPLLDLLRIVAMLDIVMVHINNRYLLKGMGLPVFIIVSIALATRRAELPAVGEVARKRAARVLLPWLVWTAFFGLNRWVWGTLDPEQDTAGLYYPWMILGGTSMHLWFLPFIYAAELAVVAGLRPLRRLPVGLVVGVAVAMAVICVLITGAVYDAAEPVYGPMTMSSPDYAERATLYGWVVRKSWLFGTASVCLGLAVGRTLSITGKAWPRRALLAFAAVFFGLTFLWDGLDGSGPVHGHAVWQWWRQALALLCVAAALQWTGQTPRWVMKIAILTMGIYLLHGWVAARIGHLFGILYDQPVWKLLWPIGSVYHNPYGKLVVVWLVTAALVALLRRTPARHVL